MKKILLIDDDQDGLYLTQHMLSSSGFDVHAESTGSRVLEIVMNYAPDLVMLDVVLPDKSGIEICKELKQRYDVLPIILISSYYSEHKKSIQECDADDFIKKPFDTDQLVNTVKSHIN